MMFCCKLGQKVSAAPSSLDTFAAVMMADATVAVWVLAMFRPPRGRTITLVSSLGRASGILAALVTEAFTFLAKFFVVGLDWEIQTFLGHLMNRQRAEVWASQSLWNNNIYHWGVMNIHQVYLQSRPALLKEALEALKEAAEFSQPSPTKRVASYTFLGFYTPLPSGCDLMGQEAASVFMPDAIVVLGHISFQENKIPSLRCVLLPPNIYKIPPGVHAKITHAHTFHSNPMNTTMHATMHTMDH
ncbi:uncharacterized protein LOC142591468 [Dermacentor variabilis]|uniref:uncharacterized protein LOC142591468 n=1 Tax=Dermacentor variabilis TaxID=34621 RepID=UPI003F5C2F38